VPLLRYQTGDIVRLLERDDVAAIVRRHRLALPGELPTRLLALRGRDNDLLPNGCHVAVYKDALYADHQAARCLTGAFRMAFSAGRIDMHVQLGRSLTAPSCVEQAILRSMPAEIRPDRVVAWPYERFPFGMSLDYERKFRHFVPDEPTA